MDRTNTAAPLPLVALERVNVHLSGRHVLHDVSWRLAPGEQWAIVGANGSGKSTLLRVIRGDCWIDDDGGVRAYALDGAPQSVAAAAPRIGYVSPELQERYTRLDLGFDGRALIATGLHDTTYVQGALTPHERVLVDAIVERFGLQAIVERPLRALSFGQLRMLLIARALVRAPRVLVLDECTNGLDRRARTMLLNFLEQVSHETHVICASHRTDDLPSTTTAYATVADGRIVEAGAGRPTAAHPRRAPRGRVIRVRRARALEEPLVEIRRADVYRGDTRVLREIEWTLRRGEHCVIRGPNGSGKSTFAELVAGTLPAAFGAEVRRFGRVGPFDVWELKRRIAHVSDALQIAYDVNPTVERVIASGFTSSIGVMHEPDAAQRQTIAEIVRGLGIEHLCGRRFLTLSFGERRKVLIARGLVHRPQLVILDEVWSGLDAAFRSALETLLDELAEEGTTLVLISHHDQDIPTFVRREFHIERGRLKAASSSPASP